MRTAAAILLLAAPATMAQAPEITVLGDYLRMNWKQVAGEVSFADLDLRKDAGVETLNRRVEAEARRICNVGETSVRGAADGRSCVDSVLASAKPQVDRVVANARR
jgi:UrcA family protein